MVISVCKDVPFLIVRRVEEMVIGLWGLMVCGVVMVVVVGRREDDRMI